eukprot:308136_1
MSSVLSNFKDKHELVVSGYIHQNEDLFTPLPIYEIILKFYLSFANFLIIFESNEHNDSFIQFTSIDICNKNTITKTIKQENHLLKLNRRVAYCVTNNNYLYRTGGEMQSWRNIDMKYDIVNDKCIEFPRMNISRSAHRVLQSNKHNLLFAIGGHKIGNSNDLKSIETVDCNNLKSGWKLMCKKMNNGRANFGACFYSNNNEIDSHIFVGGGWKVDLQTAINCSEIYSFENDKWIMINDMNIKRTAQRMINWKYRNNGNILSVCGWTDESADNIEEYDIHKNKWYMFGNKMNGKHRYYPGVSFCNNSNSVVVVCGDLGLPTDDWGENSLNDWGIVEYYDSRDCVNKWVLIDNFRNIIRFTQNRCKDLLYRAVLSVS